MVENKLQTQLLSIVNSYEDTLTKHEDDIRRFKKILEDPFASAELKQAAWAGLRVKFRVREDEKRNLTSRIKGLFIASNGGR